MITETIVPEKRLGRLPSKSSRKALMFSDFVKYLKLPEKTEFWSKRKAFPQRTFGNNSYGDCTRAKQANAIMRMERLETTKTVEITDEEVIRVYVDMSNRLYGGGDNGAYEDDALSEWRNPLTTIKGVDGHPYTIDAFLRLNASDHNELRAALALSGAHGIPICLNLPAAWSNIVPPNDWDVPSGQQLVGEWMPGSWGGHSMWSFDYDEVGLWVDHTWGLHPQRITWRAAATYLDEAHVVIDSVDSWRKKSASIRGIGTVNLAYIVDAVNSVSEIKINV